MAKGKDIRVILSTGIRGHHDVSLHDVPLEDFHKSTDVVNVELNKRDNGEEYLSGTINIGNITITLFSAIIIKAGA